MKHPKIPLAQTVVQICKLKQIEEIIISPGSRNAPLIIGFTNDSFFKCYSIVDERCAAFFALGIAQQTNKPVALVCTSGSALLNYYPAIAEAFFSNIPLVVISADRPHNLLNIGDGQTINQEHVFSNHILYQANLTEENQAENEIEINQAINCSKLKLGPIHINAPFNEPLYEVVDKISEHLKIIESKSEEVTTDNLSEFASIWNSAKRKMVLVGVNAPNEVEQKYLDYLADDDAVIVFTETTSNLHNDEFFPSIDKILAPLTDDEFRKLQPEILLTFGGMIISKKVKAFLRSNQPKYHWHVGVHKANNTYFCLDKHFKLPLNQFFKELLIENKKSPSTYKENWKDVKLKRSSKHDEYLKSIPYSDFIAFDLVLKSMPNNTNLQIGNSSAVRYVQLFDINPSLKVFCNRGTSGIDGSTSTAIGASTTTKTQTVFITGDLSFFYDSNALWNNYIPSNFRIILINNSGGGIFRILPGHKNTNNFDTYFETKHNLNAMHLCDMYDFDYIAANSKENISDALVNFYEESNSPKLLEIFTPSAVNDEVLLNYFQFIK